MVYRYYLRTSLLKEGMKLGQALTDRLDRVCVAKGTVLDAHLIQALKRMHIDGVYIEEEAKDAIAAEAEEKLPPFIKDTIEKNKVKDPAKVELSESVKKRVSEGVQYLYNNSGSEQFAETSNRITQDIPYAKILSISDVYDALVTERPYKKAYSQRDAVEIIMSMTPELDITAMRSFMESVILYPVGTNVELSNGEMAKVVRNNTGLVLRPIVVGLTSGKVYDLANDFSCANVIIL